MPTFIKTGFWDKLISNNPQQAKAPKGWLNLDNFVQTIAPPSTNIYNSDGTLTNNRIVDCANLDLFFDNAFQFSIKSSVKNSQFLLDQFGNVRTVYNTITDGIWLVFDNVYRFGQFSQVGTNKGTFIECDVQNNRIDYGVNLYTPGGQPKTLLRQSNNQIQTFYQNAIRGYWLDFANRIYRFGQISGNNTTTLQIDDAAAFPVQVSGTNVTQNTSGTASGKFLKIKVDGVDYVIELKNPS